MNSDLSCTRNLQWSICGYLYFVKGAQGLTKTSLTPACTATYISIFKLLQTLLLVEWLLRCQKN